MSQVVHNITFGDGVFRLLVLALGPSKGQHIVGCVCCMCECVFVCSFACVCVCVFVLCSDQYDTTHETWEGLGVIRDPSPNVGSEQCCRLGGGGEL